MMSEDRDVGVRVLCGNGMHLKVVGSVLAWTLAHAKWHPQGSATPGGKPGNSFTVGCTYSRKAAS